MNGQATSTDTSISFRARRPASLIFLHWATLVLIALVVGLVFVREGIDEKATRNLLIHLHRSVGLAILLLVALRIVVRLAHRPLPHSGEATPLARLAAESIHLIFYVLMFALPLLGWALSSANGKPVSFFGLVSLPPLVQEDEDLGDAFAEYHETAAWLLLGLVGIHAAAALFHHFVKRDDVLRAMLPLRR